MANPSFSSNHSSSDAPANASLAEDHDFVEKEIGPSELDEKKSREKAVRKETKKKNHTQLRAKQKNASDYNFSKKDAKKMETIGKQLVEIYENGDGSMPDMSAFSQRKRNGLFRVSLTFLSVVALLCVVAWVGFFVFQPRASFSQEDVVLSISGEETLMIGERAQYRIRYRNNQSVSLEKAELEIRYPAGFVFEEANPAPADDMHDRWDLGELAGNESGYIDIVGRLYADVETEQSFRIFLNYTPSNFSSSFQKVATVNMTVTETPVILLVDAPKEILSGVDASFSASVRLADAYEGPITNLAIVLEPNPRFTKKETSEPSDPFDDLRWPVSVLEKEKTMTIKGFFAPDASGPSDVPLTFKVIGWNSAIPSLDPFVFDEETVTVHVAQADLSGTMVVNGTAGDVTVQPGEKMHITLVVKNNGQEPVEHIRVRAVFDMPSADNKSILHWALLDDPQDGIIEGEQRSPTERRGSILWGEAEIGALTALPPGSEVSIDFSLPVKSADDADLAQFLTHEGTVSIDVQYDMNKTKQLFSLAPVQITIQSDLALRVEDSGPVAKGTSERHPVRWILTNTFHPLENIQLSAEWYGDLAWDESALSTPAGNASFDPSTKTLTWNIEQMPTSVDVLALEFVVALQTKNPTQTKLSSPVKLRAKDTVTGSEIFLLGDEIAL